MFFYLSVVIVCLGIVSAILVLLSEQKHNLSGIDFKAHDFEIEDITM